MEHSRQSWTIHEIIGAASYGLEMQQPLSRHLVEGRKTIEVRNYELPPALLCRRIYIIESRQGSDGVSDLGDRIELDLLRNHKSIDDNDRPRIIGWCTFDFIQQYTSQTDFEADEGRHLVSPHSGYAWQQGKTIRLYGWVVKECGCFAAAAGETSPDNQESFQNADTFHLAVRRKRSIFELFTADNL